MSSVDELKIALGTNDANNGTNISSGYGTVGAVHSNQRAQDDDEDDGVSVSKKTPGEIIYRDSSTFLKVE